MKNVFKIFKRDVKNIVTNWAALIVVIALMILPALYAWFNIKAMWDPYGNTQGLKIAVVNEDEGGTLNNQAIDNEELGNEKIVLGDEIESNLKDNDQIGWSFVNAEEADKGVKNGKYYASLLIPKDFTENLLSITSKSIVEPSLKYTVNEKLNAVAPKITEKGVNTVRDQVSTEVVKTVNGVIFKVLNKVGIEATNAKPELRKLIDFIYKLDENMPQIEDAVNKAYDGVITIDQLSEKVNSLMPTIEDTINTSQDVLTKSRDYLNKAQSSIEQVAPIIKDDLAIAQKITGGIGGLLDSIDENTSPEEAKAILSKVKDRLTNVNNSLKSLVKLLESLNSMVNNDKIQGVITRINKVIDDNSNALRLVDSAISDIESGKVSNDFNKIKDMVGRVDTGLSDILGRYDSEILPGINSGLSQLNKIANNGIYLLDEAEKSIPDVKGIVSLASNGSKLGEKELTKVKNELPSTKTKLHDFVGKVKDLDDEEKIDALLDLITNDWEKESDFLAGPVKIQEERLFPVPNYGSSMSPFFTSLSIWIGALLLVAIFTTSAKPIDGEEPKPLEEYFGKLLLFICLGIGQSLVATLGAIFILDVYLVNPIGYILYGILISLVFVVMLYTLVSVFGNVGKAVSIILLVLQIAAAGGTFPIQVMPKFFQDIHPFLPFTYAIDGMREVMAGIVPELLLKDGLLLSSYLVGFLIIGILLKGFVNKHMKIFSEKCEESGLLGE